MTDAFVHVYAATVSSVWRERVSLLRPLLHWARTTGARLDHLYGELQQIAQLPPSDVGHDPALVVTTDTGRRVDPGIVWDPLGTIAAAVDLVPASELMIEHLGFCTQDLLDAVTSACDIQLRLFEDARHETGILPGRHGVEAAEAVLKVLFANASGLSPEWANGCTMPARAAAALSWASEARTPRSCLLPGAAGDPPVPLPSSLLLDALRHAVRRLERWLATTPHGSEVLRHCRDRRLGRVAGPLSLEWWGSTACSEPVVFTQFGGNHFLVFDYLDDAEAEKAVEAVEQRARRHIRSLRSVYEMHPEADIAVLFLHDRVSVAGGHEWTMLPFDALEAVARGRWRDVDLWRVTWDLTHGSSDGIEGLWPTEPPWAADAAFEAVDRVLRSVGLPASTSASRRSIEDDGIVTAWWAPAQLVCVALEPPVVVVSQVGGPPDPALGPSLATDLACRTQRSAVRGLFESGFEGRPVVVHVTAREATPEETVDGATAALGVAASAEPHPLISLLFTNEFVLAAAVQPKKTHEAFGEMLLGGVQACAHVPDDDAARFLAAWEDEPPVILAAAEPGGGYEVSRPPDEPPESYRLWAASMAARSLEAADVAPGYHSGAQAVTILRSIVVPALHDELRARIATFDRSWLLRVALSELHVASAWRLRNDKAADLSRSAPWTPDIAAGAEQRQLDVRAVRRTSFVIETAARPGEAGTRRPDHVDWLELASLAERTVELAVHVSRSEAGLGDAQLAVAPGGTVAMTTVASSYDETAYHTAMERLRLASPPRVDDLVGRSIRAVEEIATATGDDAEFKPLSQAVPKEVLGVDHALKDSLGASFDGIAAVLANLRDWRCDEGVATAPAEKLVANTVAWAGTFTSETAAALALLTFTPDAAEDDPYWKLDDRPQRVATRPLLLGPDGLVWFAPAAVAATQQLLLHYMADGRLPWPDLPQKVLSAMARYRATLDSALEKDASERLVEAGCAVRVGTKPGVARRMGFALPEDAGEIDILAYDSAKSVLWVFEVKNLARPFAPHRVVAAVEKFHDPNRTKQYLRQLQRKRDAVAADPTGAMRILGLDSIPGTIGAAFVTAAPEPAAFVSTPGATFVAAQDVVSLVAHGPASPGWFPA